MHERSFERKNRLADILQREIAKLIREEIRDPRIGMVTVTSVSVTKDLSHAKVFVSVLEEDKAEETIEILNKAVGFFRSEVAKKVTLRIMPTLKFVYDSSTLYGNKIDALLEQANKNDKKED